MRQHASHPDCRGTLKRLAVRAAGSPPDSMSGAMGKDGRLLGPDARLGARCAGLRTDVPDADKASAGAVRWQGLWRWRRPQGTRRGDVEAVIRAKSKRRTPTPHKREKHRRRNLIERLFNKLKDWRRVATRYDKTAASYRGFVALTSVKLWLPSVHSAWYSDFGPGDLREACEMSL